jgi:hypothetical protein
MSPIGSVRRAAVIATLTALAACVDSTSPTGLTPSDIDALTARSDNAQDRLEAVFQRVAPEIMAMPGTVFADNDERAGRLLFGVEHAAAAQGVLTAMTRLGIPRSAYEVRVTAPIGFAATLRDRFDPTIAGIQIHFGQYLCTLGFVVDHSGGRSFITNSHCTNRQGGVEGTQYYQPLQSAFPTVIATEVADPVYQKGIPGCSKGKSCRYSDASRALFAPGQTSARGEIAQTTGVNANSITVSTASPRFFITAQDDNTTNFAIGTVANKVGRTTGWTQGEITNTCVTTNVSGSRIQQLCQTFVSDPNGASVVGGGDSGSGVFRITSGTSVTLLGILWGGSSDNKLFVFSPLRSIQNELGTVTATR